VFDGGTTQKGLTIKVDGLKLPARRQYYTCPQCHYRYIVVSAIDGKDIDSSKLFPKRDKGQSATTTEEVKEIIQ
jgi:hypothetical protein